MPAERPLGPWLLRPNRVTRFYTGGALLEQFRGTDVTAARDSDRPEDWVGSVTRAWVPPGAAPADEGLSSVDAGAGEGEERLRDLLEVDPAGIGGSNLVRRAGVTTGLLVKLLDAGVRLPVHCHPSRAFARRHLDSFFGKAEAWIVLATRQVPGAEAPTLRLGFRRPIGRDELLDLVATGDTETLLAAMHRRPARVGDTWFIPPGLPHAIGGGVFIAEVQEPTDWSILAETRDVPVAPDAAAAGLPWEVAVDAFDRRGWDHGAIGRLRQEPDDRNEARSLRRARLPGTDADPYFRVERLVVEGRVKPWAEAAFLVGIVTGGTGEVRVGNAPLPRAAGTTFAVAPAGLAETELAWAGAGEPLTLLAALPPRPEALDGPVEFAP